MSNEEVILRCADYPVDWLDKRSDFDQIKATLPSGKSHETSWASLLAGASGVEVEMIIIIGIIMSPGWCWI